MNHSLIVQRLYAFPQDPDALHAAANALARDPSGFANALTEYYALALASPPQPTIRTPTWVNHGANQPVFARQLVRPRTLSELRECVRNVTDAGGRLKVVGSGHSFSDVVQTDDVLVEGRSLLGPGQSPLLPLEDELWRDRTPALSRVRVVCGGTIRMLNPLLASAGVGFKNLGGYDAQTLIGAIATSTHGSGITLPPLPDAVRSLVLVTTGGQVYQIEPTDGITDAAKFYQRYRRSDIELVQDDDWFYSVVVSMGCMGVIYAMTVDVVGSYVLRETVTSETWDSVRAKLSDPMFIAQHRNFEVQVNPHPTWNKQRHCVVMRRDIVPHSAEPRRLPLLRRWLSALAVTPGSQRVLVRAINDHPNIVPDLLDIGLAQLMTVEPHVEDSWKMYNLGDINRAMVTAMELSFPLAGGVFVAALDRLIAVIADNRARGLYQNGPLSLRFVKASSAYLSMMHGRDTGTCEMGMINGVHGADEIFMSYERAMYAFQVRPHWGQRQELTGAPGWLQSAYPMADRWLAVHARLNHRGVFNNHFTDRMGISIHPEPAAFSETGE